GILDRLCAGSQELTMVIALAFLILACLDILSGSSSKCELALGVHVDLGNAEGNCLLDHISRDSGAAMKNQRKISGELLDGVQSLKGKSLPVCRIFSMDVADACCQ